ncbi:MAG TPA: LysR substrate-binding domain-containing protein, partial [Noviherbaspirillum sp.]|uniref:LysR substrate-binding domain-containing protein n=1 Tax=Noviherbaspirillum sp. TaxID=1926288 RepID=UPI002DDD04E3
EPSSGLRLDDLGLLLEAIRHGYGVGLTRQRFGQHLIDSGEIVELFDVRLASPPHAYYVVYEQTAPKRPEVAAFIDWMRTTFRNL